MRAAGNRSTSLQIGYPTKSWSTTGRIFAFTNLFTDLTQLHSPQKLPQSTHHFSSGLSTQSQKLQPSILKQTLQFWMYLHVSLQKIDYITTLISVRENSLTTKF